MRLLLTLISSLFYTYISAQIVVTDINRKPIPFVEVLSNNKHFYAETNLKGELNWRDLEKPSVPQPPFRFLPFQVGKKRKSNNQFNVETNESYITYTLVDKDFIGSNHFAKTEVNRIRHQVILVFRNYEGLDVSSINDFDNLLYYKSIYEYKTKHDKEKKANKILQVFEMFVEDVKYLETVNKKDFNSSVNGRRKSKYTTEFWKTCACQLYEVPSNYLLKNLYQR